MDASKSSGPYSVPVTILKTIKITPVFKKGSRFDKDTYRPTSVLSNFSKLFEKAMYHRLYSCLEELKILYPVQFGFREKCSTTMLLFLSLNLFASPLIIMNLAVVYL